GRRKKEEERGKREEGYPRKKKPSFPVDIHPWVYTNDINGHDIRTYAKALCIESNDYWTIVLRAIYSVSA
ncbi:MULTISPECIES: hypothetical protein, partial [unclassified Okeania]|uniref:hypothetical protein n=1 Tax=unclassified Okeania TaxID=2634635 RepID=UPI00257D1941